MMRKTVMVVVASLVAGLLVPAPASAAPYKLKLRPLQKERSVAITRVPREAPAPAAESETKAWKGAPAITWPAPGKVRATDRAAAGSPVSVSSDASAEIEYAAVRGGAAFAVRSDKPGPLSVSVDLGGLKGAVGGDWVSRARLVRLPECALTTPELPQCRTEEKVTATRAGSTLTARVEGATVLAAVAAPQGASGTYRATSLAPTGLWSAGGGTGSFTYNYPIPVPSVPGSLEPEVSLDYDSTLVDGRTASTNNQPSWIGEGWEYEPGFIERTYQSCPDSGEQCWKSENATLSLNGSSTALVRDDASGTWKLAADDGSRVQWLNDHWVITKPDGTQYWFGTNRLPGWTSGKPETRSVFSVPVKDRGVLPWRWQLDHVVDPHGNAMAYYYERETNSYNSGGRAVAYDRGGYLQRIEYGLRAGNAYTGAGAQVEFTTAERCLSGCDSFDAAHAGNWPDVPFDLNCSALPCANTGPSFWTRKRLTAITTKVGGTAVDTWTLSHTFPGAGDSTSPALWLTQIQRTAPVALPPTTFHGQAMENRVDADEGRPPLNKYRMTRVHSDSGTDTLVGYLPKDCTYAAVPDPAHNNRRCFPSYWTPPGASTPIRDWFHKYAVEQVVVDDKVGGSASESVVTTYGYENPAWAKDDSEFTTDAHRTYNLFKGYQKVRTKVGTTNKTQSETVYLRGLGGTVTDSEGNQVSDDPALSGRVLEELTYTGEGGSLATATVTEPWLSPVTATRNRAGTTPLTARMAGTAVSRTRTAVAMGWRRTRTDTAHDDLGRVTAVSDQGDLAVNGDETCATTAYTDRDTANWLLGYVATSRSTEGTCAAPGAVTSETRTLYDGQGHLAAPKAGQAFATRSEKLQRPGTYVATATGYDAYGRVVSATDELGRTITTAYTPATGAPATIVVTDPKGFTTTSTLDPLRGQEVSVTDRNGNTTQTEYDALGRLTRIWLPSRARSASPSLTFDYRVNGQDPAAVTTTTLRENGTYATSIELLDGLLRSRQTQQDGLNAEGGRLIVDTHYDTHGRAWKTTAPYWNKDAPRPELGGLADNEIPAQTVTEFDGRGRPTEKIFMSLNVEQQGWRTSLRYGGDYVATIPPEGDSASMALLDARGKTVELRQFKDRSLTGAYDTTRYTYDTEGQLRKLADPAGNEWTYDYDLLGHKTTAKDPDVGVTTYTYDAAGQAISSTDARGVTVVTDYDELGRRKTLRQGETTLAQWAYDSAQNGKGLLASSTRWDNGNAYVSAIDGYTATGAPTGTTVTIPAAEGLLAGTYKVGQTYTPVTGLPKSTTYQARAGLPAEVVTSHYTDRDQLAATGNADQEYLSGAEYTPYGELLRSYLGTLGRYAVQTFTYEQATRRLRSVVNDRQKADPQTLDDVTYTYNPAGDVTSVLNKRDDQTGVDRQCFGYDHRRRLTSAYSTTSECDADKAVGGPAPYSLTFGYDVVGNRISETADGVTRTFTYTGHLMKTAGGDTFGYDAAGNTTRRVTASGEQTLTWNAEGKLAATQNGSSFLYDADGDRLLRRDPSGSTLYLGSEEFTASSAGLVSGRRFYQAGKAVLVRTSATKLDYLLTDQHGTAEVSINASSLAYQRRATTPFGTVRGAAPATWSSQKGFVGGTIDDSTGLTHIGAREYDADNGRFVSADPVMDLLDPQQVNGYAYASNNPVTWSDPDGLKVNQLQDWGDVQTVNPNSNAHCATKYCADQYNDPAKAAEARQAADDATRQYYRENNTQEKEAERAAAREKAKPKKKKGWWDSWGKQGLAWVGRFMTFSGGMIATIACGVSIVCGMVVGATVAIAGYVITQRVTNKPISVVGVVEAGAWGVIRGGNSRVFQGSRDAFKDAINVGVSLEKGGHRTLHAFKHASIESRGGLTFYNKYKWQWNAHPAKWFMNNRYDRSMLKKPYRW
ncbi:RHS repeat-associated core domain-containing protein [Nonomuraea sp. NPDC050556]|uniref:RHS repeat-associated core domain-containing protein n=1 Tax=Nonomuraea sp. NPDC050556 TaxID=3364369 RepID=UPI0037B4BAB8